jgi:hypothetical protein
MRNRILISTIATAAMMGTAAIAQTTAGGGMSVSTPKGSVAGGASAGTMMQHNKHMGRHHRQAGNSASTYGAGTIYTDRNHASGGVTAGGTATGTGNQNTSSMVDAYGTTTRQGSDGEVYGGSTANSTTPTNSTTPPHN